VDWYGWVLVVVSAIGLVAILSVGIRRRQRRGAVVAVDARPPGGRRTRRKR